MARRLAALLGFFVLVALVVTLLWRMYVHHQQADPYERDEAVTVRLDAPAPNFVKIAAHLS